MTPRPEPRLAPIGDLWSDMLSDLATFQADLLRRMHGQMADARERDDDADNDQGARDE